MNKGRAVMGVSAAVAIIAAPLIMQWEGLRQVPYRDPVGILTVCYGHTGSDIIEDKRYSHEECQALLNADMAVANAAVNRCLPMPKLAHIEAALTSATFNIGPKVVCGSTLQRKALANDWPGACAQLARWNRASHRVIRGLTLRRMDEQAVCEGKASV